jgi:prevent-host-death family protein
MKTASVTEVKSRLGVILKATEGGPVVVTRDGRPVAVILGVRDNEDVERLLTAVSPRVRGIVGTSRKQIEEGRGIGAEEFRAGFPESAPRTPKGRPKGRNGTAPAKSRGRNTPTTSRR